MNSIHFPWRTCFALVLCLGSAAFAEEPAASDPPPRDFVPVRPSRDQLKNGDAVLRAFKPVVEGAARSTVRIVSATAKDPAGRPRELALATVVDRAGLALTKASQLDKELLCKLPGNRVVKATVVATQVEADLALLQIDASDLTPVEWSEKVPGVGQWLATASPGELPVAVGVVSVRAREIAPERGVLGVAVTDESTGPKVNEILPDSSASRSGVKKGDIILEVNGKTIPDGKTLAEVVSAHRPGTTVPLRIKRDEETVSLNAILGRRFDGQSRGQFQNSLGGELSLRRDGFASVLQHDTVLRPEDCGGPIVALDGKAVGINIARAGRTESYAIPVAALKPVLGELVARQARSRAMSETVPTSTQP